MMLKVIGSSASCFPHEVCYIPWLLALYFIMHHLCCVTSPSDAKSDRLHHRKILVEMGYIGYVLNILLDYVDFIFGSANQLCDKMIA